MQRMMRTLPIYDYEKGGISEEELYSLLFNSLLPLSPPRSPRNFPFPL